MNEVVTRAPRGIATIFGCWLAGLFAASLISREESPSLAPLIALGLALSWPLIYFLLLGQTRVVNRNTPLRITMIGGIVVFSGISVFVSPAIYTSLGYWVLNLAGIYIAVNFSARLDADAYAKGLRIYVLAMLPLLIGLAWYSYVPGARLGQLKGPLNPNAISLVTMSVVVAACIFSNRPMRYALIAPGAVIIYLTGSRSSAVAVLMAFTIVFVLLQGRKGAVQMVLASVILAGTVSALVLAVPEAAKHVDQYFAINDKHRGIQSGAAGRVQTWEEVWDLALDHPLTGVGLRAHEGLLKTNTSAHNGYLATLAEIGFMGFVCVMALIVAGIVNLLRRQGDEQWLRVQAVLLGLAMGYMVLALFERYLLNFGNPTSLLFLMAILFPRVAAGTRHVEIQHGVKGETRAVLPDIRLAHDVGASYDISDDKS